MVIGRVSGGEARLLLESVLPTSRFMCSAVITATATILALMFTLLSLSVNSDQDFDRMHFVRIKQIAFYDMLVLMAAAVLLVLHCVPVQKSDELPGWWYPAIYHSLLLLVALLGGAVVSIVVMLYTALCDLIRTMGYDDENIETASS